MPNTSASEKPVALVTGASSGIGKAVAIRLGREGYAVAMIARRPDVLAVAEKEVAATGAPTYAYAVDVTDHAALEKAMRNLLENTGRLDLLFANAGVGSNTPGKKLNFASVKEIIDLNVTAFADCVTMALPPMLARNAGRIVGVSSLASYRGMPAHGAYSASKAFVATFLESLRIDLRGTGVRVTAIFPGFVRTPMTDKNNFKMPFLISADEAADHIWNGIANDNFHVSFPFPLNSVSHFAKWLPNSVYDWFISTKGPKD